MKLIKFGMIFTAIWTAVLATTGCASGGWKITRQYAQFVNKQSLIIRIILYILTLVVFAVTIAIDAIIFNTMDFWEGRVSQGIYQFNKDGRQYVAHHSYQENKLRVSRLEISENGKLLQEVILRETPDQKIDVIVDGVKKAEVDSINSVPNLSYFDAKGVKTYSAPMFTEVLLAKTAH